MKSLDERKANREKQKEAHKKESSANEGTVTAKADVSGTTSESFDPKKNLSGSVSDINESFERLTDEQLARVEEEEKQQKEPRQSVLDSVKKERDKRKAAGSGWGSNV
jgi:hypothetical protein